MHAEVDEYRVDGVHHGSRTADEIVVPMELGGQYQEVLFRVARDRFDWSSVAGTFSRELSRL